MLRGLLEKIFKLMLKQIKENPLFVGYKRLRTPVVEKAVISTYKKENSNYPSDFVVFDVETTGLNQSIDEIVQLSAVKYINNIEVDRYNTYINPRKHIPIETSMIHGIYDKDVKDKPVIEEILPKFISFIENFTLVAHNASFDMKFIQTALNYYNQPILDNKVIDTLTLARRYIKTPNHKLETLKNYLNLNLSSHNSLNDCIVTGELYKRCRDYIAKEKCNQMNNISKKSVEDITDLELACYKCVYNILEKNQKDTTIMRCHKTSYFNILVFSNLIKIKISSKNRYALIDKKYRSSIKSPIEISEAVKSEGIDNIRVKFNNPEELVVLEKVIIKEYDKIMNSTKDYMNNTQSGKNFVEEYLNNSNLIEL